MKPQTPQDQTWEPACFDVLETYEEMSRVAAQWIAKRVRDNNRLLLCAATGSTPTRTYDLLAGERSREPDLFSGLRVLKLDEWGGLRPEDPGSCDHYLQRHLLQPLAVELHRFQGFDGRATPPENDCHRLRAWLQEQGPIDVCVLGLGKNGHLGFNEPGPHLYPWAHCACLSPSTQEHAMIIDAPVKPDFGFTLGMAEILQSREILLLVSGEHKRDQLRQLFTSSLSTQFPASFLALHPRLTCLCDEDAASLLFQH